MKKIITKFISILLLVCVFAISASANSTDIDSMIDELSRASGLSREEVRELDDKMIRDTYNSGGIIVSISKEYFALEDNKLTRGTISTNDFELTTLIVTKSTYQGKGVDKFDITAKGSWKKAPFFYYKDAISIEWSDDFTLISQSCSMNLNGSCVFKDSSPERAVVWEVDINGSFGQTAYGYATIQKNDQDGTANVTTRYAHVLTAPNSIGVSIGTNGVSFSIGFGSSLDTAANTRYFNY